MISCGVLGAVVGLFAGLAVHLVLERLGALRLGFGGGRTPQFLAGIWTMSATTLLAGVLGASEGVIRGTERLVYRGGFRTEVMDRAGLAAASAVWHVDSFLGRHTNPNQDVSAPDLDAFLGGRVELDVRRFVDRVRSADDRLLEDAVDQAVSRLGMAKTIEEGGLVDQVIRFSLRRLLASGETEARSRVPGLGKFGAATDSLFQMLLDSAAASGNPATISPRELSDYLLERTLVPAIVVPTRVYVRTHQAPLVALLLGAIAAPVVVFWILRQLDEPPMPPA